MKKRFFLFMGLCFSLAAVVSCSSGGAEEPAEIKEAVADTDYSITYYWGPPAGEFYRRTVLQMKEAGFDTDPAAAFSVGSGRAEGGGVGAAGKTRPVRGGQRRQDCGSLCSQQRSLSAAN